MHIYNKQSGYILRLIAVTFEVPSQSKELFDGFVKCIEGGLVEVSLENPKGSDRLGHGRLLFEEYCTHFQQLLLAAQKLYGPFPVELQILAYKPPVEGEEVVTDAVMFGLLAEPTQDFPTTGSHYVQGTVGSGHVVQTFAEQLHRQSGN